MDKKYMKLTYYQATKNNQWYFYFADYFSGEQQTRAFKNKEEANQYANINGIKYNEAETVYIIN